MIELFYLFILFILAIGPPFLMMAIIWYFDKLEREPKTLMLLLFFLGMLSCLPIAFSELFLGLFNFFPQDSLIYNFVDMFFVVGVSEEIGKYIILFLCTWWAKSFTHKYDAIVYSVAVSLGFATLENIMYILSSQFETGDGLLVAIIRGLFSIPGHCSWAIIMGLFYGLTKHCWNKKKYLLSCLYFVLSLSIPIFLHGLFDFCLVAKSILLILVFLMLVFVVDISCIVIIILSVKYDKMLYQHIEPSTFFGYGSPVYQYYKTNLPNQPLQNTYQTNHYNNLK